MTLVGTDARMHVHAARQDSAGWSALCSLPVLASAVLRDIHEQRATDDALCAKCRAHLRAALDEGSQNCGD